MEKFPFRPIQHQPLTPSPIQKRKDKSEGVEKVPFSTHFKEALRENSLVISKHAKARLIERDITISENRWQQIEEKVKEAKALGVRESLVLLEDAALIVSAKNNTVITAMNRHEATSQIFTNINGTIVIE